MAREYTRRRVLRSSAGGIGLGVVSTLSDSDGDGTGPSVFEGRRIHKYRPRGEYYTHVEQFVSRRMKGKYGKRVLEYPRSRVPREAIPAEKRSKDVPLTISNASTAVIGTFREHAEGEHTAQSAGRQSFDADLNESYTGPLYAYKSDVSDPGPDDLGEASGPINVAWNKDVFAYPNTVKTFMEDSIGWAQPLIMNDTPRYVTYYQDTIQVVVSTDEHVRDSIDGSKQYHVRLFDVSNDDPYYYVIGQAHKDPYLHNGPPWDFDETRDKTLVDFDENGYASPVYQGVGNGNGFDTADGLIGRVHRE